MRLHDLAFCGAGAFLTGVFLASIYFPAGVIFLGGAAGFVFFLRRWNMRAAILALTCFIFGYSYVFLFSALHRDRLVLDTPHEFSGIVAEEPLSKANSQQLTVNLLAPYRGEVRIYVGSYPEFAYGDHLSFYGIIQKSSSGAIYQVSFPKVTLLKIGQGSYLKHYLFAFKEKFIKSLQSSLQAEESALLTGLLTGGTADFSQPFKEAVQKSGMSHVVALSGYNISVIGIALSFLLAFFLSPSKAFYFSIVAIVLFVVMTGASASAVRAAVMGIILLIAKRAGRLYSARNAIVLTAAFMVLLNPRVLAYDIGFQLSFGALLGIIYAVPVLEIVFKVQNQGFLSWKANALATFSAQIAVLPLLLFYFQQFNIFSIFANVLILQAIPITMLLGFFLGLTGFFSHSLAVLIALPVGLLLKYQIVVINFFSYAPLFALTIQGWIIFGYYGFLAWFLTAMPFKKKHVLSE